MFTKHLYESPLVRMYRTEYNSDYERMRKNGLKLTEDNVKLILGYPVEPRKKFLGIF